MNDVDRKLIVFEKDCDGKVPNGEKQYIKCEEDRRYATLYLSPVAPRYLKDYLYENGYEVGYEIENEDDLNEFEDKIYTFVKEKDSYKVTKGIELIRKRILLVDIGMGLNLSLPMYRYDVSNNGFRIFPMDEDNTRSFCYVADENDLTPELRKIMLPVLEVIPGFLSVNSYPFVPTRSYKKKRNVRKSTNYKNRK